MLSPWHFRRQSMPGLRAQNQPSGARMVLMANRQRHWREELNLVVDMMRDLSRVDDPQEAAVMYGRRLRAADLFPMDERISVSRRNLKAPLYRITRSSTWK